ncbi:hypothetical protein ANANG_G00076710, partial [Anguilla anguilla]
MPQLDSEFRAWSGFMPVQVVAGVGHGQLQQTALFEHVSDESVQVHEALMVAYVMGQDRQHHG